MTLACMGTGTGTSRGIAIGKAHLMQRGRIDISPRIVTKAEIVDEVDRFRQAVSDAKRHLKTVKQQIPYEGKTDIAAFIDTHLLMLNDSVLIEAPIDLIRQQHCSAEWALQLQRDSLVRVFEEMEDPFLRTRKDDVDHVVRLIQELLLEQVEIVPENLKGRVILAQDLTPADTILMRQQGIAAFVTEFGGPMSHTTILARSLGIPAVVGVRHATHCLQHGELLIVDGELGVVLVGADLEILEHYRGRLAAERVHASELVRLLDQPTISEDGQTIQLMANIELPEDIETTLSMGADGVGLYRTEFLYMNRTGIPQEDEHYETYKRVVQGLDGIPITIRTIDLGAEKQLDGCGASMTNTCNPALGLRAIRLCLKEPQIFLPQLRAILRVAALGPVRLMFPMITNLQEVHKLLGMVKEVKQTLLQDGLDFAPDLLVGGMIEVPAAALAADAFAHELDFLSIGTNDLIQYTLAIDRVDDEVNYLYDPYHPAVLRLINMVINAGSKAGIPVSMCGEMAGDPRLVPLLLGMGLRELSMQPRSILEIKEVIRNLDVNRLTQEVNELMTHIEVGEEIPLLIQSDHRH